MSIKEWNDKNDKRGTRFDLWRLSHRNWYVINCKSNENMMLHRAGCEHFDFHKRVNLVAHAKICAEDAQVLRLWAQRKGVELRLCKTCM